MVDLPENIQNSRIITVNQLELLAGIEQIPLVDPNYEDEKLKNIFQYYSLTPNEMEVEVHRYASELIAQQKIAEAWQVLLTIHEM